MEKKYIFCIFETNLNMLNLHPLFALASETSR